MKRFEDFGLQVAPMTPAQPHDITQYTDLAIATYDSLGLVTDEGRARETFYQNFQELHTALPAEITSEPYDLLMVPKLGELSLTNLIQRFDALTTKNGESRPQTSVWSELWNQYSHEELNQGQIATMEAQAVRLGGGHDSEAGLYHTSETLAAQRELIKTMQEESFPDVRLMSSNIASYFIQNTTQLQRGEPLLDVDTYTRFPELPNKAVGGASYVGYADSSDRGLVGLYGSRDGASPDGGVRLSVGPK